MKIVVGVLKAATVFLGLAANALVIWNAVSTLAYSGPPVTCMDEGFTAILGWSYTATAAAMSLNWIVTTVRAARRTDLLTSLTIGAGASIVAGMACASLLIAIFILTAWVVPLGIAGFLVSLVATPIVTTVVIPPLLLHVLRTS